MSWFWLALSASVAWGLGYIINQVTLKHFSAVELMYFETLIIFVILSVYFIFIGDFSALVHKLVNPKQLLLILCSAFIYVLASWLILKSIIASNAGLAAIIESSYPIFTIIFAFIFLGELQLNIGSAIGFIFILVGIIIVKVYGK